MATFFFFFFSFLFPQTGISKLVINTCVVATVYVPKARDGLNFKSLKAIFLVKVVKIFFISRFFTITNSEERCKNSEIR